LYVQSKNETDINIKAVEKWQGTFIDTLNLEATDENF
jgi:hypothetical protein